MKRKRTLSLAMALVMWLSVCIPGFTAFAEGPEGNPQSPVCICETKCTEGETNTECAVCMADWNNCVAAEQKEEDKEASAPVCTCETKCAEDSINADCAVCGADGADLTSCEGQPVAKVQSDDYKAVFGENAEVYWDGTAGDDSSDGTKAHPVKTFEKAKELLAKDGTIYICGPVKVSGTQTWSLEGYGNATLQRCGDGYMIELLEGVSLTLEHITINGLQSDDGTLVECEYPAILADQESSLTLNDGCVIQNNYVEYMGAAISGWRGMTLTMNEGAIIQNNSTKGAHYGGAIFLANDSTFTMNGGEIKNNVANRGGGIALIGSEMTMTGGSVSGNKTVRAVSSYEDAYGGAIYIADYEGISGVGSAPNAITPHEASFTMTGGTISDNTAEDTGGAILTFPQGNRESGYSKQAITVKIDGGTISNNTTENGNGGGVGLYYPESKLEVSGDCVLSENKAPNGYGGGIFIQYVTDAEISGGKIDSNIAKTGGGVAIWGTASNRSALTMSGGRISQNKADGNVGGGVYLRDYCRFEMTAGSITENQVTGNGTGGGLYLCGNSQTKITGGSISGNTTEAHLKYKDGNQWIPYQETYSKGILLASQATLQIGGTTQIASDDDVTISVASWSGSSFYSYIQVIDPEWNNNDESVSVSSYSGSGPKYTVEDEEAQQEGTLIVSYNTESGAVESIHVEAAQNADNSGLFVPSMAMLEANPTLAIGQSKIDGRTNIMTYVKPFVTIAPADVTIYVGGNGYTGVVDQAGQEAGTENGFPVPGFTIKGITNFDPGKATLKYDNNGDEREWDVVTYDGVENATHGIYRFTPIDKDTAVRMQFEKVDSEGKGTGEYVTQDKFTITDHLDQDLLMEVYGDAIDAGYVTLEYEGNSYKVRVDTGTLKVRSTTAGIQYGNLKDGVVTEKPSLTAPQGTNYYINNKDVRVADTTGIALLFDNIIENNNIEYSNTELLEQRVDQELGTESTTRQYELKYLDLVDRNNGNVWVAADQNVTVYWPLPKGTTKDTKFSLFHFQGMHREMSVDEVADDIMSESLAIDNMTSAIEVTDTHVVFEISRADFSPFALVWDTNTSNPDNGGGGAHHPEVDPNPDPKPEEPEEVPEEDVPLAETPWLNTDDHYAYIIGYPEDYVTGQPTDDENRWPVKPQANITRAEVATIFFRLLTDDARDQFWSTSNNFSDVTADAWYNNAVSTMVNAGIIQGYEDGTFRPNNNITRAEFAAIASRFMSSGYDVKEDLFSDIANHWARENINDAAMTQWIHGYPDGTFRPDQAITRAEAVTLVNNVLQRKPDADHMLDTMIEWPDNPESAWYYEAIQEATNSHDYDLFEGAEYETWTALQPNRDWAALEADWLNAHRTGGEVM